MEKGIILCSIFHPREHGIDEHSTPGILNNFIVEDIIRKKTFYKFNKNELKNVMLLGGLHYHQQERENAVKRIYNIHPTIRNYKKLCKQEYLGKYRLEIGKYEILDGEEMVCYLTTFWLRIFQRIWRKRYEVRLHTIKNLYKRQIYGRLPMR